MWLADIRKYKCDACGRKIDSANTVTIYPQPPSNDSTINNRDARHLCKDKCEIRRRQKKMGEEKSKKEIQQNVASARAYHDFRIELKQGEVLHDEDGFHCWCGEPTRHRVTQGPNTLFLCTHHFAMWFKLPSRQQIPKSVTQRRKDRLKRRMEDPTYTPPPPFDEWAEREIMLKCQYDPAIHFTGQKIAEQSLNAPYGHTVVYITVYKQTVDPKSIYVSITMLGISMDAGVKKTHRKKYWVMEVEYKKSVPTAIKAFLKTMKRPRGDYEKRSFDDFVGDFASSSRKLYRDLNLRNVKDALQLKAKN